MNSERLELKRVGILYTDIIYESVEGLNNASNLICYIHFSKTFYIHIDYIAKRTKVIFWIVPNY